MNKKQLIVAWMMGIVIVLSICGCKTVHVGGSGRVGGVGGSGTVVIDVPE